jgi:hypothetical protein
VEKDALSLFDLQLSGHTHKGQIFPFTLLTRLYYRLDSGYLANGAYLYVSGGSGTWGPPIRLLAPAEVTLIELSHGEKVEVTREGETRKESRYHTLSKMRMMLAKQFCGARLRPLHAHFFHKGPPFPDL